jgi:hypothetical protein
VPLLNVASGGAVTLKPQQQLVSQSHPGLCTDGQNGDIYLYHKDTKEVVLNLTIDPRLGRWPLDPDIAFTAQGQSLTRHTSVSSDQATLTIYLKPEGALSNHPYTATFINTQNAPQQTEPGIQNH